MEATELTDQLIEELRYNLGRAEKLRLLQILVDELAADETVHETLAPAGNRVFGRRRCLSDLLQDAGRICMKRNQTIVARFSGIYDRPETAQDQCRCCESR